MVPFCTAKLEGPENQSCILKQLSSHVTTRDSKHKSKNKKSNFMANSIENKLIEKNGVFLDMLYTQRLFQNINITHNAMQISNAASLE